jgi:uncharacterized membrane protein YhiD involved in acid resistance
MSASPLSLSVPAPQRLEVLHCNVGIIQRQWIDAPAPAVRLMLATILGLVVTAAHTRIKSQRTAGHSLARAQTLLCVAGALTMILIDNSVARAFGIAGAASIVRFRTPVEDPTDATVMFLLMALGMACGIGAFGVAAAGAVGVSALLICFGTLAPEPRRRNVIVEIVGRQREFPSADVHRVFARHGIVVEPCQWSQDAATRLKYRASVTETVSLESLGADLMNEAGERFESVAWEVRKGGS